MILLFFGEIFQIVMCGVVRKETSSLIVYCVRKCAVCVLVLSERQFVMGCNTSATRYFRKKKLFIKMFNLMKLRVVLFICELTKCLLGFLA